MDSMISLPSKLFYYNYEVLRYPADIERGFQPYLGMDLALLGVVKEAGDAPSGSTTKIGRAHV